MAEAVYTAEGVSYRYGREIVLENVSLCAYGGECVGIAGVNGSGKSTLLSILAGVLRPAEGRLICCGYDLLEKKSRYGSLIGYVPQENPLLGDLSVADNLKLWSGKIPDVSSDIIQKLKLDTLLTKRAGKLSGGQKRRVTIACALLGGQQVLVMDEPTSALDIGQKEIIHRYIREFTDRGAVVIMATHDIMEMELCDRLYHLSGHKLTEAEAGEVAEHLRKETDHNE